MLLLWFKLLSLFPVFAGGPEPGQLEIRFHLLDSLGRIDHDLSRPIPHADALYFRLFAGPEIANRVTSALPHDDVVTFRFGDTGKTERGTSYSYLDSETRALGVTVSCSPFRALEIANGTRVLVTGLDSSLLNLASHFHLRYSGALTVAPLMSKGELAKSTWLDATYENQIAPLSSSKSISLYFLPAAVPKDQQFLWGTLNDLVEKPLVGSAVFLYKVSTQASLPPLRPYRMTVTNESGHYFLGYLKPGSYFLGAGPVIDESRFQSDLGFPKFYPHKRSARGFRGTPSFTEGMRIEVPITAPSPTRALHLEVKTGDSLDGKRPKINNRE